MSEGGRSREQALAGGGDGGCPKVGGRGVGLGECATAQFAPRHAAGRRQRQWAAAFPSVAGAARWGGTGASIWWGQEPRRIRARAHRDKPSTGAERRAHSQPYAGLGGGGWIRDGHKRGEWETAGRMPGRWTALRGELTLEIGRTRLWRRNLWGVRKKRSGRQGGGGARAHCKVGGAKDQPTNGGAAAARRLNPAKLKRIARAVADVSMTQARSGSLRTSTGRRRAGCVRCIPANTRPGYRPSGATRRVCRSVRGGCERAALCPVLWPVSTLCAS
mmetsp:Transcript_1152/g.3623  ORF Transcript_1152/g.3623 Transcript_1152/m.3623 type:complete len:275 (+) Transcript_1152:2440-3264(+)